MSIDNMDIRYKNLGHMFEVNSGMDDRSITFIVSATEEARVTYRELYNEALDVLSYLQAKGIKPGAEIIFQIADNRSFVSIFWACILGGIVPVPIALAINDEQAQKLLRIWRILENPYLIIQNKLLNILKDTGALNSVHSGNDIAGRIIPVEAIQPTGSKGTVFDAGWDDTAFIQFSSGSTGDPKGVVLTHGNLLTNMRAIIKCSDSTTKDSVLSWMPLTHDMGLIGFHMTPLMRNVDQYLLHPQIFMQCPVLWLKKINQYRITLTASPNFGYKHFLSFFNPEESKHLDLSCIRLIFNGAEPVSAELSDMFHDALEPYGLNRSTAFPVYGMAEATLAVAFPPPTEELVTITLDRESITVGSKIRETNINTGKGITFVDLGYCVDNCMCRICDEDGTILEEDTIGFVQIKGEGVTRGFYKNKEATEKVFTKDGWLDTGDLGFTRNGRLVVTGRAKDIIFVNGQNYYPHDIERVCEEAAGVNFGEVAACGVFDPSTQSEEVVLFVINKKSIEEFVPTAIELKKHVSKKLNLTVKNIIPINDIPKTSSNKTERYKLGDIYKNGGFDPVIKQLGEIIGRQVYEKEADDPKTRTEAKLLEVCKDILEAGDLGVNDNLSEMGADSMKLARVQACIDEIYPGKLTVTDLFTYPTIAKLAEYIEREESIQLEAISLPAEYFNSETQTGDFPDFEFSIYGSGLQKIKNLSETEGIEPYDVLAAMYIYLFEEVTENKLVTIQQTVDAGNRVAQLSVDFSQIDDFTNLFKLVHDRRLNSEGKDVYSIHGLSSARINKSAGSVIPFVYRRNYLSSGTDLTDVYDLMLGIDEASDRMEFVFQYNGRILCKEKVKVLIDSYLQLVETLAEKYSTV